MYSKCLATNKHLVSIKQQGQGMKNKNGWDHTKFAKKLMVKYGKLIYKFWLNYVLILGEELTQITQGANLTATPSC